MAQENQKQQAERRRAVVAKGVNPFEDLVPRDVPKLKKALPTDGSNPFEDLVPKELPEQRANKAEKGDMAPGAKLPKDDLHGVAANGVLLGYADEIGAGITAPLVAAGNLIRGEGPTNIGEAYDQQLAYARDWKDAVYEAHPTMAPVAEVTGALATAKIPARLVLKGAPFLRAAIPGGSGAAKLITGAVKGVAASPKLVPKIVRGAGVGAAYGAVQGFGEGEGGLENRLESAEGGAKIGFVLGGGAPVVGKVAGSGVRLVKAAGRAITAPIRSLADKETFAAGKTAEALQRDRLTLPRAERILELKQRAKPELVLADVGGENTRKLLRSAANVPSPGRDKLTRDLRVRQDGQLDRIRADVGAALGDPKTFTSTVETLATTRKANAKPLYAKAFATGTPWTVPLQEILQRPIMRTLVERARTAAANNGEEFKAIFAQQLPNGKFKFSRVPATEDLHRIKLEIDKAINGLKSRTESSLGNIEIRDLTRLKHEFLGTIENKPYKHALRVFAGDSAMMNAIDDGFEGGLKMEPEAITKLLTKELSPTEADLWRLGFARRVVNQLRDTGRTGTNRADILSAPKYLDRLRAAFKDDKAGKDFLRALSEENKMFATKNAVQGNSSTAAQLAEGMEAGVDAEEMRRAADMGSKLLSGDYFGALVNWVGRAKNKATGLRPEVADEIIRMLTTRDPVQVGRAQMLLQKEVAKLKQRQALPGKVESAVNTAGFGAIPSLQILTGGR